jgi:Flp pilus assembly pilin Flp
MSRLRTLTRDDRGALSAEYAGVVAFVAGVVIAILLLNPGLASTMSGAVRDLVCQIIGGDCVSDPQLADDLLPDEPCVTSIRDQSLQLEGTALFVHLGGKVALAREERSDGTVAVSLVVGGKAGGEAAIGAKGNVQWGDFRAKAGAEAAIRGGVEGEGGDTWEFPDAESADDFIDDVHDWARDEVFLGSVPIAGDIYNWFSSGDDFEFPESDSTYVQGGAFLDGEAEAGIPGAEASVTMENSIVLGTEITDEDRTVYLAMSAERAGKLSILPIGAGGSASGELVFGLKYDNVTDELIEVEVTGTAGYSGSVDLELLKVESLDDLGEVAEELDLTATGESENTLELKMTLDMTDPANKAAWDEFWADPFGGGAGLLERMDQDGIVSVQTYDGDVFGAGLGASVAAAAKAALSLGYESSESQLTGAWVRVPGQGFVEWADCTGGG